MSIFSLPGWIKPHLYQDKKFDDLSKEELEELKSRLSHFNEENPDVSVVIPAWNEENNIYRALSSLASSKTVYKAEIVVINNNSTDRTQMVLDTLGVRNYLQTRQGTPYARQLGLEKARGKYHLCADSDTFYPPQWIDLMVKPMTKNKNIAGVYGRYSFIPPEGQRRFGLWLYEKLTGIIIRIRKFRHEYLNMLGFNMGLVTETGRLLDGFKVSQVRKFDNAAGSNYFVEEGEDGRMAISLLTKGRLKMVTACKARVYTSPRRLVYDGGIWKAFMNRFRKQGKLMGEYITGKNQPPKLS